MQLANEMPLIQLNSVINCVIRQMTQILDQSRLVIPDKAPPSINKCKYSFGNKIDVLLFDFNYKVCCLGAGGTTVLVLTRVPPPFLSPPPDQDRGTSLPSPLRFPSPSGQDQGRGDQRPRVTPTPLLTDTHL